MAGPGGVLAGSRVDDIVPLFFMPIAPPLAVWPIHMSHIREGSLESFLLLLYQFFLLPLHVFFTAPVLLFLPELQVFLFLRILGMQLFYPFKFLKPHSILPH